MNKVEIKLNVKDQRLKLVGQYYINGEPGKPESSTKMIHKDHVNSKGYFSPSKLIKC